MSRDRIEKSIILRAPLARVWRALTEVEEFNAWFRVALQGRFEVGHAIRGNITHAGYEHVTMEVVVERIDAPHHFAFRWHPYAIDPAIDYGAEPSTLVEFELQEVPEGTQLRVAESGFDRLPAHRRDEAFRMNDGGWQAQLENIGRHVTG